MRRDTNPGEAMSATMRACTGVMSGLLPRSTSLGWEEGPATSVPRDQMLRQPFGYQFTIAPGDFVLELEGIDQMFPPGDDGYAPLTNTIWTWMMIDPASAADTSRRLVAVLVLHRRPATHQRSSCTPRLPRRALPARPSSRR
jgi:hypothetical protein